MSIGNVNLCANLNKGPKPKIFEKQADLYQAVTFRINDYF